MSTDTPPATARSALKTQRVVVPGPSGDLEAAIDSLDRAPTAVAVVCHPHPLQQGTMHNKVVTTLARAFVQLGADVVRFNFRGVGASSGSYADGVGERADALAVAEWSRARWPGLPLYLGGFSFGGAVAVASAARIQPRGLVTVAPPVEKLPPDLALPACPWLLVHGSDDDVVPLAPTRDWVTTLASPPELLVLDGVGHFFHGKLRVLEDAVTDFFAAGINADLDGAQL